jgi:predicted MFS family arabinose efflux permease
MSIYRPWVMWFFATSFFAYQFIMRVFTGLCVPEIMHKFQIDATEFGLFSAMYYYGYAGMQIPVAYLLDRFGPRLIITLCCFICSSSIFLFYWTENWYLVLLSRFLIGAASAAGFLGTSKVISLWFPFSTYARMVGLTFSLGLLGAIYGGKPVSLLITYYGWENVLLLVGMGGLFLTLLLAVSIQSQKLSLVSEKSSLFKDLKSLFTMRPLLLIAACNFLMVGALEGFADVWGVPYLVEVYSFEKSDAAFATSCVFTGMLFGGPLLAYLAEKYKASYQITGVCGLLMAFLFTAMLLAKGSLSYVILCCMMFIVGLLCCYQVLVFAIGAAAVPEGMRNITIAFLNCINMLGGSFFHTFIGTLMDFFWTGTFGIVGQRLYEADVYTSAISLIPLAALIGGGIFFFLKPSRERIRQQV